MKNRLLAALTLIFFVGTASAQNMPWRTYSLTGFSGLDHVEIVATAFPLTTHPAMDNLVLNSGGITTMGFEGVAPPGVSIIPVAPYSEGGYTLIANDPEHGIFSSTSPDTNTNGTDIFGWCGGCNGLITLSISKDDTAPFAITSIDLSNLGAEEDVVEPFSILVTGFDSSGAVLAQQVLAVTPAPSNPIPALSGWALLSRSLLLLIIGGLAGRKAFQSR